MSGPRGCKLSRHCNRLLEEDFPQPQTEAESRVKAYPTVASSCHWRPWDWATPECVT